jgi:hypothetical protein
MPLYKLKTLDPVPVHGNSLGSTYKSHSSGLYWIYYESFFPWQYFNNHINFDISPSQLKKKSVTRLSCHLVFTTGTFVVDIVNMAFNIFMYIPTFAMCKAFVAKAFCVVSKVSAFLQNMTGSRTDRLFFFKIWQEV